MPSPAEREYRARLDARRATRDALTAADRRFAYARLATFFSGIVLLIVLWLTGFSFSWLLAPVLVFVWLVRAHERVLRARAFADRGIAFYDRGLARIEDRWVGTGDPGERFQDDEHPYANDLDLFGRGSLFELLSIARTRTGEAALAEWLKIAADAPEIQARQEAVAELAPSLDFREQLALAGADFEGAVDTGRLIDWAEVPMSPQRTLRAVIWISTACMAAAALWLALTAEWWPLLAVILFATVALHQFRAAIGSMLSAREPGLAAGFVGDVLLHRSRDLQTLAELLRGIEKSRYTSIRLAVLRSTVTSGRETASRIIRRLHLLTDVHGSLTNTPILPAGLFVYGLYYGQESVLALGGIVAGLLLLVRPHVALAVERWRSAHGAQVRVWVDTVAAFEALNSIAAYRYEHEGYPFPQIVAPAVARRPAAAFDALQLGHPLMPRATMVPNDVCLDEKTRLLVVSGSNMSGKSTLLRAVGINVVLALAGAPVCAASLRLSPLAVGATLRIQDSLLEGRSRFYAEITRIRKLVDIAEGPVPLLFLLDELFHGTNSHDRLIGAQGVLRSLLDRGAVGLITTHDLALTAIAQELAPHAANVHFQDWFEGGEMRFDYRMRPGPVARSNALALMRAVGLDVQNR